MKTLSVTITLAESNKPYKHIRYYNIKIDGSVKKFNEAYQMAEKWSRLK